MSPIGPDDDTPPLGARPDFLKPGFTKTAEGSHLVIDTRKPANEPSEKDGLAPELTPVPVPDFSNVPLTPTTSEALATKEGEPTRVRDLPVLNEGELFGPKLTSKR